MKFNSLKTTTCIYLFFLTYSQIGFFSLGNSNVTKESYSPIPSSDGQFIDHVLQFSIGTTYYDYNFSLIKNKKYEFSLQLYTPHTEINIGCTLVGPDGNGDGFEDIFNIAEGDLIYNKSETGDFKFSPAISGEYHLKIKGITERNTNVHFLVSEGDQLHKGPAIIYDNAGYFDNKMREYVFELVDDKTYQIMFSRTNSLNSEENFAYVDINLVYLEAPIVSNNTFILAEYVPLANVFIDYDLMFGTSKKGQYKIEVTVSTNVDTINLNVVLLENAVIGDGPEDDPLEPIQNITENNSSIQISIYIPEWTMPVIIGGLITILSIGVYFAKGKTKKRKFESI